MKELIPIRSVTGRPLPLRGNDIDTDRIIPARYMKAITFDGLGRYAFYDVRFDAEGKPLGHVVDDPRFQTDGSRVAVVNKNFGCGSSREHAPQALLRCGIRAIVGESFADIFFGNCVSLGIPCVTLGEADVGTLMTAVETDPEQEISVDLEECSIRFGDRSFAASLPEDARQRFLDGSWDATRVLLAAEDAVRRTASTLPYINGFAED